MRNNRYLLIGLFVVLVALAIFGSRPFLAGGGAETQPSPHAINQ
ncbi:hypothetical protein [Rhizobium oryzicola]|uniref:Uncharacterized protein n=1 Tax=Rhizobium oryzicola TaxID=1232668 RepID=A0ABT8SRS7_9HYPH|nr:hypothetical protein [Rhizobium oryzicola]MDO1581094.1 hypothetical protein [Rhizobium oryzicola]